MVELRFVLFTASGHFKCEIKEEIGEELPAEYLMKKLTEWKRLRNKARKERNDT